MIGFIALFLFGVSDFNILEKAELNGFFYKNALCKESDEKVENEFYFTSSGKSYSCRQLDSTKILLTFENNALIFNIVPDTNFMAYYIYIKKSGRIEKIKLKQRTLRIEKKSEIEAIQITALSSNGPVVIYKKEMKEVPLFPFSENMIGSINSLRKSLNLRPLELNSLLKKASLISLKKVSDNELLHIKSDSGSPVHSGVRASVIGENLFRAESIEKGWEMMQKSPSHLYNITNPEYTTIWIETVFSDKFWRGAIIFGG